MGLLASLSVGLRWSVAEAGLLAGLVCLAGLSVGCGWSVGLGWSCWLVAGLLAGLSVAGAGPVGLRVVLFADLGLLGLRLSCLLTGLLAEVVCC